MSTTPNAFAILEDIMDNARAIANDAYNAGAGEILTDTAPFTISYINSSLQELQDRLENNAVVVLTVDNYIRSGLEPVNPTDPSVQTFLGFDGYGGYTNTFDISQVQVSSNLVTVTCSNSTLALKQNMPVVFSGLTSATFLNGLTLTVINVSSNSFTAALTNAPYGPTADTGLVTNTFDPTFTLPPDMMTPQFLWERQTGSNLPFVPMVQPMEGLQSRSQTPSFAQWEWRGNAIYFLGATTLRDIRLRYQKREANITAGTDFTTILIDLPGAYNALSYMIAFRYVMSRNPETAPLVGAQADKYIREIIKRTVRQKQGIQYFRASYDSNNGRNRGGRIG
jgi:hypothetical protein